MSNISTLKNELCFLEKGLSKSCKILRNNKYYLVLDLLWLEAYTFITMIRKFTGVDVILNRFSIDTKIEKSSVFKCDQHVLRLTKYDDKKKLKFILMSAVLNFKEIFEKVQITNDKKHTKTPKTYYKNLILFNYENLYKMYCNLLHIYKIKNMIIDKIFVENFEKYRKSKEDGYTNKFFVYCMDQTNLKKFKSYDFFDCFFLN